MDRLVKIILLIIGLSVAFIWISNSFASCKADSGQKDDLSEYADHDGQEVFEGEEIDYSTSDENDEPIDEEIVDDTPMERDASEEIDFTAPPTQKPQTRTQTRTQATTSTTSGQMSGDYMVIAGNYLVKSNAENMTDKLRDLGYRNAEIAVFDNSQYHTVIAARYNSYQSAAEAAGALKRQGVDCYVKKKQ